MMISSKLSFLNQRINLYYPIIFILTIIISSIDGGCYQRHICCKQKDNTCKDIDDGIRHLPLAVRWPNHVPKDYQYNWRERPSIVFSKEDDEKLGRLVLPDIVQLNKDGIEYLKKSESSEYDKDYIFDEMLTDNDDEYIQDYDPDETIEILHFGDELEDPPPHEEHVGYLDSENQTHAYIRYSLINRYIPVRVEKVKKRTRHRMRHSKVKKLNTDSVDKLVPFGYEENKSGNYLSKSPHQNVNTEYKKKDCYCDEACIRFGDCCSDYTFVCPPVDCKTTEWEVWGECIVDSIKLNSCGEGQRIRKRKIIRMPENGGSRCGSLIQRVSCFKECKRKKNVDLFDETTVALILDYQYNMSRKFDKRHKNLWKLPKFKNKLDQLEYYCVEYKIDWLNRNCIEEVFKKTLYQGATICAECQPEAQLHRKNHRCASDLENGEVGFWKLVGPKSCNGIWTRISRTDTCKCSLMLPNLSPYLLV
uniref:SMB domain-containing protein n=1 Tax=Parastrongyloides trichosuri TaxID=131310 RepID=A0A0N4ZWR6_PARTI